MRRAETEESTHHDKTRISCELESELHSFETSNQNGFNDTHTVLESQKENGFLDNKKYGCHEISLLKHNKLDNCEVNQANTNPIPPPDESSKQQSMPWREKNNLKIRYTRQYLLDRRFEPLSTTFPECLLEFLQSENVPLKEENYYDQKSMDHILFYTTLPYIRRMPFKQCYF